MTAADFKITSREKNLLVVLVVISVLAIAASYVSEFLATEYVAEVSGQNRLLKNELSVIGDKLAKIQDEEELQSQYIEAYKRYDQLNLIEADEESAHIEVAEKDEEQRLFWLTRLQEIRNARSFFNLTYDLGEPQIVTSDQSKYTRGSSVAMRVSTMRVKFNMLHELDMLMLLGDFYDEVKNHFSTTLCRFSNNNSVYDDASPEVKFSLRENMSGVCELVWITVLDPEKGKERQES